MSTVGSSLTSCPVGQAELNDFFINCDPALIGYRSPFNEFLWNPRNRKGLQQVLVPMPGKKRGISLRYDQAISLSEVQSGTMSDITCTAETERGDLTSPYEVPDSVLWIEEKMTPEAFEDACRDNGSIIMRKIGLMMKALREATYKKTADEFYSNAMWGKWSAIVEDDTTNYTVDGTDNLVVKTFISLATRNVEPFTMETIDNALLQTQYCDAPFITGGNTLYTYARRIMAGCCANQGVDIGTIMDMYGKVVTWDKYLQAASAFNSPDYSVAIMPGALQVLTYNRNDAVAGMRAALGIRIGANYETMSFLDPISGMPMNMTVADNCGVMSVIIWTNTKLVQLPADMFAVGEDMDGVQFVNKIKVLNS